jgi:hypothetical protein
VITTVVKPELAKSYMLHAQTSRSLTSGASGRAGATGTRGF